MNAALGTGIRVLHLAFLAWMVWAPFSGDVSHLKLHAVVCPFLMLHWALHTDGCALSVLEAAVRGVPTDKSFIHSIVAPVYVIEDATIKRTVWTATMVLWTITLLRLYRHDATTRLPLVAASHS